MPLGRWQHASGQQGLVPGRAVTPYKGTRSGSGPLARGSRHSSRWAQLPPASLGQCTCVALPALTLTVNLPHCSEVPGTGYFNVHVSIYQSIYADDCR